MARGRQVFTEFVGRNRDAFNHSRGTTLEREREREREGGRLHHNCSKLTAIPATRRKSSGAQPVELGSSVIRVVDWPDRPIMPSPFIRSTATVVPIRGPSRILSSRLRNSAPTGRAERPIASDQARSNRRGRAAGVHEFVVRRRPSRTASLLGAATVPKSGGSDSGPPGARHVWSDCTTPPCSSPVQKGYQVPRVSGASDPERRTSRRGY
jgi:hypothetical protein